MHGYGLRPHLPAIRSDDCGGYSYFALGTRAEHWAFVYVGSMGFIAMGMAKGRADVALEAHVGTPVRVLL